MYDLDLSYIYVSSIIGICTIRVICTCFRGGIRVICMICHVFVCSRVIICVGSCISKPLYTRPDILTTSESTVVVAPVAAQVPPGQPHNRSCPSTPRLKNHVRHDKALGQQIDDDVGCGLELGSSSGLGVHTT